MSESVPPPEPSVVVGYPATPPGAPTANPGVAALRGQVRTIRALVLGCLALLVLLTVGFAVSVAGSRAQIDDLTAQVAALSARAAAPAPASSTRASESVTQLGAAPALASGTAVPSGADDRGAILIGDPQASNVVEVYIDYQCPFCQRWESGIGAALVAKALTPGSDLLVKQYNLAFLGETSPALQPAGASARAASAAACVLEADGVKAFAAFSASLFAKADPKEPPGQFTEPVLTQLATDAGASPAALACIAKEVHVPFVAATTRAGFTRGVAGTPTVIVNGTTVGNPFTDPTVTALAG